MSPQTVSPMAAFGRRMLQRATRLLPFNHNGLRILMWHSVGLNHADRSTVDVQRLDRQLRWLRDNDYNVLSFSEVLQRHASGQPLPPRSVVLTFDDACASFPRLALPALMRAGFSATLLVPVAAVSGPDSAQPGLKGHMSIDDIDQLPDSIDIGLHSYEHRDYRQLSAAQIGADVRSCSTLAARLRRSLLPVFAYPFGGVPRNPALAGHTRDALKRCGMQMALRIGYGINRWPFSDPWRLKRIAVHGTDSMFRFACKLSYGRVRL
jgi:peptidoglycan/xylan/chitin deacetylase (PgdA/CDA1 family)